MNRFLPEWTGWSARTTGKAHRGAWLGGGGTQGSKPGWGCLGNPRDTESGETRRQSHREIHKTPTTRYSHRETSRRQALRDGELQGDTEWGEASETHGETEEGETPRVGAITGRHQGGRDSQRQGNAEGEETTRDRVTRSREGSPKTKRVTEPKRKTLNGSERRGQKERGIGKEGQATIQGEHPLATEGEKYKSGK